MLGERIPKSWKSAEFMTMQPIIDFFNINITTVRHIFHVNPAICLCFCLLRWHRRCFPVLQHVFLLHPSWNRQVVLPAEIGNHGPLEPGHKVACWKHMKRIRMDQVEDKTVIDSTSQISVIWFRCCKRHARRVFEVRKHAAMPSEQNAHTHCVILRQQRTKCDWRFHLNVVYAWQTIYLQAKKVLLRTQKLIKNFKKGLTMHHTSRYHKSSL